MLHVLNSSFVSLSLQAVNIKENGSKRTTVPLVSLELVCPPTVASLYTVVTVSPYYSILCLQGVFEEREIFSFSQI